MNHREADRADHPPACTCTECVRARLGLNLEKVVRIFHKEPDDVHVSSVNPPNYVGDSLAPVVQKPKPELKESVDRQDRKPSECCPVHQTEMVYVSGLNSYWCEACRKYYSRTSKPKRTQFTAGIELSEKMIALLFIVAVSIIGLGTSLFVRSPIPFWVLLGFSLVFSVEKWFSHLIGKYKSLGKLYRLLLNLSILVFLGLLIWSGVKLFSQKLDQSSLVGSLIFLGELVFFVWLWRVISKNSWRFPSMKLTVFVLLIVTVIFSFAGVQPLSTYKDSIINSITAKWNTYQAAQKVKIDENRLYQTGTDRQETVVELPKMPESIAEVFVPTVLLPTMGLVNPTWSQLLDFLASDKTDEMPYIYPTFVCDNFASTLQHNAKVAGWRCAKVRLDMIGYTDPYGLGIAPDAGHSCNAFETTDRGLVYIDVTGWINNIGALPCDRVVDVVIGQEYNPQFLFYNGGWYMEDGLMGTVTGVNVQW